MTLHSNKTQIPWSKGNLITFTQEGVRRVYDWGFCGYRVITPKTVRIQPIGIPFHSHHKSSIADTNAQYKKLQFDSGKTIIIYPGKPIFYIENIDRVWVFKSENGFDNHGFKVLIENTVFCLFFRIKYNESIEKLFISLDPNDNMLMSNQKKYE